MWAVAWKSGPVSGFALPERFAKCCSIIPFWSLVIYELPWRIWQFLGFHHGLVWSASHWVRVHVVHLSQNQPRILQVFTTERPNSNHPCDGMPFWCQPQTFVLRDLWPSTSPSSLIDIWYAMWIIQLQIPYAFKKCSQHLQWHCIVLGHFSIVDHPGMHPTLCCSTNHGFVSLRF